MLRFALVCLGGALGSGARYLVATGMTRSFGADFPRGTILVNFLGSFLIAVIMHLSLATEAISPDARLFLTTGIMGGFTTYSTFNYETIALFEQAGWSLAALNLAITMLGCLAAGALGLAGARWIVGR